MKIRATAAWLMLAAGCAAPPPAPASVRAPPREAPVLPVVPAAPLRTSSADTVLETRVRLGPLGFAFRAAPVANLAFQLDCLAELIHCSRPAFHELWAKTWGGADDASLATWRAVRSAYETDVALHRAEGGLKAPLPVPFTEVEYEKRLRVASYIAETADDYGHLLDALVRPGDAQRLREVVQHFWPRFAAFWRDKGRAIAEAQWRGLSPLLSTAGKLGKLVERAARFYGADLPEGTVIAFDLIARPPGPGPNTAEHVDNHLVVEVEEDTKPEKRVGVLAHELFHFFYAARPADKQVSLIQRFSSQRDPLAIIAYDLLDESLATAFGNGLAAGLVAPDDLRRRLAMDNGLYDNAAIDRTAKALLPQAESILDGSLDDDAFPPLLVRAVHDALGDAPPPVEYVRNVAVVSTPAFAKAEKVLTEQAHSNHVYGHTLGEADTLPELLDHPELSAVLFVTTGQLADLSGWTRVLAAKDQRALQAEAKRGLPFVYAVARSSHAYLFVFVAGDAAAMEKLVTAFCARTSALTGVMRL